jgi:pimeloyl-ACP methyl ester carboxylesterase
MTNQESTPRGEDYSTQRLSQRYRFADPNMDLFFLGALGWGPAGGLSVGEAFYLATQIEDGNGDSWARAFEHQGEVLNAQADTWLERGWTRASGEARLKAFACYRSAWQFVAPGERFAALFHTSQKLFDQAMTELDLPATRFTVRYRGGELPGHFYQATDHSAPTVLVIGGADTCHEDRFLSQGRYYIDRGYSVALVDLPGQGLVQEQGLHWEPETERPIAAVIDALIARFGVEPRKLALLGMSLGGYFACRAAAHEPRLAAVIATPALFRPDELLAGVAKQEADGATMSDVALKNRQVLLWKAGAVDFSELMRRWDGVVVDPSNVQVPFLSVLGKQEGGIWKKQTEQWHASIRSTKKSFVILDAETGADAHCQGNNPLRLAQEVDGWLREVARDSWGSC